MRRILSDTPNHFEKARRHVWMSYAHPSCAFFFNCRQRSCSFANGSWRSASWTAWGPSSKSSWPVTGRGISPNTVTPPSQEDCFHSRVPDELACSDFECLRTNRICCHRRREITISDFTHEVRQVPLAQLIAASFIRTSRFSVLCSSSQLSASHPHV